MQSDLRIPPSSSPNTTAVAVVNNGGGTTETNQHHHPQSIPTTSTTAYVVPAHQEPQTTLPPAASNSTASKGGSNNHHHPATNTPSSIEVGSTAGNVKRGLKRCMAFDSPTNGSACDQEQPPAASHSYSSNNNTTVNTTTTTTNEATFNLDSFPTGYRFCPTDEELVKEYLLKKVKKEVLPPNKIAEINLYANDPETITENYPQAREGEWYFFTPRNRKYVNGGRPNRAAGRGYWKATGPSKPIPAKGPEIGSRKALVFYAGNAPKGTKTDWIMQEYVVTGHQRTRENKLDMKLDDYVLCKIYKKNERGGKKARVDVASDQQQPTLVQNNPVAAPPNLYHTNTNMLFPYDLPSLSQPMIQMEGYPTMVSKFNNISFFSNHRSDFRSLPLLAPMDHPQHPQQINFAMVPSDYPPQAPMDHLHSVAFAPDGLFYNSSEEQYLEYCRNFHLVQQEAEEFQQEIVDYNFQEDIENSTPGSDQNTGLGWDDHDVLDNTDSINHVLSSTDLMNHVLGNTNNPVMQGTDSMNHALHNTDSVNHEASKDEWKTKSE